MKRLIVLVDDDAQFCDAFREYLTYRDYDCLVYHDSRSAFNGILRKKGTIWGIVVDLELVGSPEQGDVLIDLLRTNGITEPIVVLTNDVSVRSEQALLANRANDYIRKCYQSYPVLLSRIDNIWAGRGVSGNRLTRGALCYDTVSRVVTYRGKSAKHPLDVTAGKALELLMSHPGRLATYAEISQKTKSVLAAELEAVGLTDAIRTERGLGYVLEACE